ncbi:DnaD domain protein [Exiguobacterium sp. s63]|uniref:DnaD domain-containing protein n=1 Tax=Exiguobacterium sp. s63 TaxID=2751274 RepID=UPI001BE66B58
MAIYRQIHIDFWQDEMVADFTPEDKYFFLYLMTNNKTTQSGVYRINKRVMAFDLGWDKTTVDKMIERFVGYGRIKYNEENSELIIMNWLKYNSARSPKVAQLIDKQLMEIKTNEFKEDVITLCIQYGYPIQTISQPEPTDNQHNNHNQQNNQQTDEQLKNESVDHVGHMIQVYESFIGIFPSGFAKELEAAIQEFGFELVERSIRIASETNNRNWKYIQGIHRNWSNNGIDSIQKLNAFELERKNKQSKTDRSPKTFKPTFD